MSKSIIKEFYINSHFGCKCQKCFKEVHGKQAHLHHSTSRTKLFNMANIWGLPNWEKEAKKCTLLCADCHNALHSKYGKKVTHKMTREFLGKQ